VTASSFDYESKRWGSSPVFARPWHIQGLKLRYALEDLSSVRSGRVLDVGCGGGNMAKAIKRERPELDVHGVDTSRNAIASASADPQGVEFQVGTAERLPFEDGYFSAVTMFDVLEHLDDPAHVLREISRVLRPGGVFHVALPLEGQPGTIYHLIGAGTRWKAKVECLGHVQVFSENDFQRLAAETSLPVIRVRWSYHHVFSLIDVIYFSYLQRRGGVSTSVADYVSTRRGWSAAPLRTAWSAVSALGWAEARTFRWMRGACGHFTCRKQG
jgi:SAM-dependent methyltransferase